jgi:glycopeptide antibiotics resistance protein
LVQIDERAVFAVIVLIWVIYRVIRNLAIGKFDLTREFLLNLAFVYGCLLFKLTFFPMNIVLYAFDYYDSNLIPLVGTIQIIQHASTLAAVRNIAGNLGLLVPLGILLPIFIKSLRQLWKILGIGFLVSLSIELSQLTLKVRVFDVDDLIFNTLGVLIGFLIFLLFSKVPVLSRLFEKLSSQVLNQPDRYFSFRFMDEKGNNLMLSMAQ